MRCEKQALCTLTLVVRLRHSKDLRACQTLAALK